MIRSFVAVSVILGCGAASSQEYLIHGNLLSCSNIASLDYAITANYEPYFRDWTKDNYDDAIQLVRTCPTEPRDSWKDHAQALKQRRDQLVAANKPPIQPSSGPSHAELRRQAIAAETACTDTDRYHLFYAQEILIDAVQRKKAAQKDLEHERKIASVSGAVDLQVEHDDGAEIVLADDDIQSSWPEYRKLGGKAATPQTVTHALPDPCEDEKFKADAWRR